MCVVEYCSMDKCAHAAVVVMNAQCVATVVRKCVQSE